MNPLKVRYSCFLVCLSVLLAFSWSAPAIAGDAAGLRLAAGPSWGGAGTPLPVPSQRVMPVRLSEPWDVLWMDVWKKTNGTYRIGVADTLKQAPGCTGNLGLEVIVEQTVRAVRDRKFGDAVNYMAQFQDRSLCLNFKGARGLEFALAYYAYRAFKELPADQQRIAIHGTFNLGMLAYDQISDTKRSWWQGIVGMKYYPQMVAQMNAYPILELGFWSFNFQNGMMEQGTSKQGLLDMLATLANPKPVGGTKLGGGSVQEEKGNTGAGSLQRPAVGTMGAGVVSCTVAASRSTGPRGIITCQQKAMAGTRPSFTGGVAGPFDPGVSVRDPQCAKGEKQGGPWGDPSEDVEDSEPPDPGSKTFEEFAEKHPWTVEYYAKNGCDYACSKGIWDGSNPNPPLSPIPSKSTPSAPAPAPPQTSAPANPKTFEKIWNMTLALVNINININVGGGTRLTAPGTLPGPGRTGDGCINANASNAARHMQAVANCLGIGSGSPKLPTPAPGGIDPTIARFSGTEPQTGGGGKMDCLMQAGSLVRTSSIDPKCAKAMCAPGAPCSCEPGGGVGSQAGSQGVLQPPLKASPDCMDPNAPCGPGTGGITPGKTPPVGPMGGPTPGPSTTSVPATRGIGTVPQLQQQKGTIPASPLQQIGR